MSPSGWAQWLIVAAIAAIDAIGLAHYCVGLSLNGLARGGGAIALLAALAAFYTYRRPDDRVVDRAREQTALDEALVRAIDVWNDGNLRQRIGQCEFVFRHEDPDVALHLAAGKAAHEDSIEIKLLCWQQ